MTARAALPPPEIVPYRRHEKRQACPCCGHAAARDKPSQRTRHDLGHLDVWCPRDLVVTEAQHSWTQCRTDVHADRAALAPPSRQSPPRVMALAGRLVVEDGLPYRPARGPLWRDHRVL